MTAIYNILETIAGSPADPFQELLLFLASIALTFILLFGILDLMYIMFTGWWGR